MKKLIVANWKEHKTSAEATSWLEKMSQNTVWQREDVEVVLCPAFTLLHVVKIEVERLKLPITLGSQDFPAYDNGAFTGEEPPSLLKEFIRYAIIGHSERRKYFAESHDLFQRKITLAKQYGIEPIFCIQDLTTPIPSGLSLIAYEPVFAIGTGNPDTPENAEKVALTIQGNMHSMRVLYGGSVTDDNVSAFTSKSALSGVLVGTASLDPLSFIQVIQSI